MEYNQLNLLTFDVEYFLLDYHSSERYGQAFFDQFQVKPKGVDIFYEEDDNKARKLAWEGLNFNCPKCYSQKIEPCGRGGYRCVKCGNTWGAD
jgi:hypothetical protein